MRNVGTFYIMGVEENSLLFPNVRRIDVLNTIEKGDQLYIQRFDTQYGFFLLVLNKNGVDVGYIPPKFVSKIKMKKQYSLEVATKLAQGLELTYSIPGDNTKFYMTTWFCVLVVCIIIFAVGLSTPACHQNIDKLMSFFSR